MPKTPDEVLEMITGTSIKGSPNEMRILGSLNQEKLAALLADILNRMERLERIVSDNRKIADVDTINLESRIERLEGKPVDAIGKQVSPNAPYFPEYVSNECNVVGPHSHFVSGQTFPCEKDGKPAKNPMF